MIAATLAALADPTRRGVVDLLRQEPRRAGDLARELDASAPAMSRHLKVLRQAGLVALEVAPDDARVHVYRLCPEPFGELKRWVEEVEAFWAGELAAFAAYADSREEK